MDSKSRKWLILAAVCVCLPLAGIQFQNLFWSTARVENHSGRPLTQVALRLNDDTVELGTLAHNQAKFVRLPVKGETTLRVQFSAGGGTFAQCQEYVEAQMYYVQVVVEPNLMADCRVELDAPFHRFMLWEMLR